MGDFIRIRCPFCGSMPYPKQLENWADKKAEVRIILMTIGGKVKIEVQVVEKFKKKGKGQTPGGIVYNDVTDQYPELVEQYTKWFGEQAVKFAQDSGLIPGG